MKKDMIESKQSQKQQQQQQEAEAEAEAEEENRWFQYLEELGQKVMSVAVSSWARVLENQGIKRRLASIGVSIISTATKLRLVKRLTGASARHVLSVGLGENHPKIRRAAIIDVHRASRRRAITAAAATVRRGNEHGKVVSINEADIEEVHAAGAVECELSKGCRRGGTVAGAVSLAGAAVACSAGEEAGVAVGGTVSAGPEPAGPGGRYLKRKRLSAMKREAGGAEWSRAGAG
ncbi:hypothetical protein M5K25_021954 [Dendrobium thyrsiflorum]|uniref:Uncharacterized protein n=1 Tax=Dendrobium thyrsiflorum TaxID=117978 RepID=A0ABD0U5J3_DENTH